MEARWISWTSALGGAALLFAGCVADTSGAEPSPRSDSLSHQLDPSAPLGPGQPDRFIPFDAGTRDASRRGDIPGRDDDRSAVDDVPYEPVNERLPMTCGGESNDTCPEDMVCCRATTECVPEDCPDCCNPDDWHRFTHPDRLAHEELPDVNPAGPPPEDDGRDGMPEGDPDDPDPGPMPPPNAP